MAQQPAMRGIRAAEALGLTIFLATAAVLTALFITWLPRSFESLQTAALQFSTLCAMVAAFAMLWDAFDLWVRGRRMTPHGVRLVRSLVFVAVIGALATSILGKNNSLVLYLAPAMVTYLFIARRRPADYSPAAGKAGSGGARSTGSSGGSGSGASRSRQRRGGKKHR